MAGDRALSFLGWTSLERWGRSPRHPQRMLCQRDPKRRNLRRTCRSVGSVKGARGRAHLHYFKQFKFSIYSTWVSHRPTRYHSGITGSSLVHKSKLTDLPAQSSPSPCQDPVCSPVEPRSASLELEQKTCPATPATQKLSTIADCRSMSPSVGATALPMNDHLVHYLLRAPTLTYSAGRDRYGVPGQGVSRYSYILILRLSSRSFNWENTSLIGSCWERN
jgi:hypothetical protein